VRHCRAGSSTAARRLLDCRRRLASLHVRTRPACVDFPLDVDHDDQPATRTLSAARMLCRCRFGAHDFSSQKSAISHILISLLLPPYCYQVYLTLSSSPSIGDVLTHSPPS
jgi:hypothetical protein